MTGDKAAPPPIASTPRIVARAACYALSWPCFVAWLYFAFSLGLETTSWLFGLAWAFALVMWCREDAIIRSRPLPTMSLWVVLFFWPIAVPVCVLRLYGLAYGLTLVILHTLIYAAAYFLAYALASAP